MVKLEKKFHLLKMLNVIKLINTWHLSIEYCSVFAFVITLILEMKPISVVLYIYFLFFTIVHTSNGTQMIQFIHDYFIIPGLIWPLLPCFMFTRVRLNSSRVLPKRTRLFNPHFPASFASSCGDGLFSNLQPLFHSSNIARLSLLYT